MIRVEQSGAIATMLMSRPPVNAIDPAFVLALNGALGEVEQMKPTVLVVRSDQRCFCAGADLTLIRGYFVAPDGVERMIEYVESLHGLFNRLESLETVTLAVIDGPALGGGLELALACDLRIASTRAKLGLPEARVGMIPGAGGTQRLTRLCGPGVSSRLILGGEIVDGAEAARLGIVQWSADAAELDTRVGEIATHVAGLSRGALVASKDCIAAWFDPAVDGYAREIEKPRHIMRTEEARQRVEAFFASKAR
ncbi:enoyl-CoA hydratase/isomerase family protein [Bradyrhizobium canariense]|uniref:Enoyl-CoA hydratase/carnithine racemase n=1 Tax=Bradyrhizobium canariense TaxID=255045 RepID=A0A1H1SGC9_9BRAD|nr:enoyl-CoA hydratase/isomerase family protein [Bradyrhizobium canariense]SDS46766.1 Enoyl-CoA hydratase/carnithine racemase [Bradyrhizobium canariense]